MTPERFKELLEEAGYETRSYSGRGMYGKECIAVKNANPVDITLAVQDLGLEESEDADIRLILAKYREDSLGKGIIIYWTQMEYPDEK